MTNRILVGAVFLVGCAVGGASSQLVVPKASAQQAAQLTKWEFKCSEVEVEDLDAVANKFGAAGWDIAGITFRVDPVVTCFKRPKM